jgi:hypothetical protein
MKAVSKSLVVSKVRVSKVRVSKVRVSKVRVSKVQVPLYKTEVLLFEFVKSTTLSSVVAPL